MSYKKALIRLLDRPGGRFLLGKLATHYVQRHGANGVEIIYLGGLWTRKVGLDFFPDSPIFSYNYADFSSWNRQMELYASDTKEYWFQHYAPKEGDVIIDVGAGRGEDTLPFSRSVGKTGRVIAIEAHPITFKMLRSFCTLNKLNNVTVLHLALLDQQGTAQMSESETSWMENSLVRQKGAGYITVPTATLDAVCEEQKLTKITFVKMNIEGAERQALLGMRAILPRVQHLCVACHDFLANRGQGEVFRTRAFVEQFLAGHGFDVTARRNDPRDWVRDHIFGVREQQIFVEPRGSV